MPAGVGYGLGRGLMRAAKGWHGGAARGAVIGGALGAGYGALSDRQTIVGGMFGGAVRGAGLGFGYNVLRTMQLNRTLARSDIGFGGMMARAAKVEAREAMLAGRAARRFIGSTTTRAVNRIQGLFR